MTWFFAVIVVAVMGGVAVVASGRGGAMAETFDDRPDSRVPADRRLTAPDLRRVRFSTAFRGYRMAEVDALLDRLAAELDPGRAGPADAGPTDAGPADADPSPPRAPKPGGGHASRKEPRGSHEGTS